MSQVAEISASNVSDEFVVHVPQEYDYHYKSSNKTQIIEILRKVYSMYASAYNVTPKHIKCTNLDQASLKDKAVKSKAAYRLIAREAVFQRGVGGEEEDEEEKNEGDNYSDIQTDMLGGTGSQGVKPEDFDLLKVLGRGTFGKVCLDRLSPILRFT